MRTMSYLRMLGIEFETSRQSNPLSQDSIESPEAYLIDSKSSIFLKRRPASEGPTSKARLSTRYLTATYRQL